MRVATRIVAALLTGAALIGPQAVAQAAPKAADGPAQFLLGRWVGTYAGYENGAFMQGREKIVVTTAHGYVAKGTWQFKEKGGTWSAPAPVEFVVQVPPSAVLSVTGQDVNGYYNGFLKNENRLVLSYVGRTPTSEALRFTLSRR